VLALLSFPQPLILKAELDRERGLWDKNVALCPSDYLRTSTMKISHAKCFTGPQMHLFDTHNWRCFGFGTWIINLHLRWVYVFNNTFKSFLKIG